MPSLTITSRSKGCGRCRKQPAESSAKDASIGQIRQEARGLVQALAGYTVNQRDAAIRQTGAALDRADKRIDALETRIDSDWERMDKAAREKARANLKALRKQRTRAAEWYGGLKNSSADAWEKSEQAFGSDR